MIKICNYGKKVCRRKKRSMYTYMLVEKEKRTILYLSKKGKNTCTYITLYLEREYLRLKIFFVNQCNPSYLLYINIA